MGIVVVVMAVVWTVVACSVVCWWVVVVPHHPNVGYSSCHIGIAWGACRLVNWSLFVL